ncbi:hypothetical protein TRFO_13865 [Tritrichomonas foetus]|uniref:Inner membrane component domain-containing protein n=1 Tax=Tritrichomonas foetus TaxID=1144522 RepID=A0A1J4KWU0_9EUKA|nr:hypothetical protein TRFO_13865 [Tritrichomonas foetus]|eukprot:OHT15703.1 hypothetical protein TRFO_13865 [Tritrichomonas foetus]
MMDNKTESEHHRKHRKHEKDSSEPHTIENILFFIFGGEIFFILYCIDFLFLSFLSCSCCPLLKQYMDLIFYIMSPVGKKIPNRFFTKKGKSFSSLLFAHVFYLVQSFPTIIAHLLVSALLFITIVGRKFALIHFNLAFHFLFPVDYRNFLKGKKTK